MPHGINNKLFVDESNYITVAEASSNAIFTFDTELNFKYLNSAGARLFHVNKKSIAGKSLFDIFSKEPAHIFKNSINYVIETVSPLSFELQAVLKNETRYFTVTLVPIVDNKMNVFYVAGMADDVTFRKKQEHGLFLFRRLLDHSNDAIFLVDANTARFIDFNETACKFLNYSRNELLRMKVTDIDYVIKTEKMWRQHIDQMEEDKSIFLETVHVRKDKTTYPVELSISYEKVGVPYIIAVARDVTERLRQQKALEKTKRENKALTNELKQKYHTKNIIGNSEDMVNLMGIIEKGSNFDVNVVIQGESGTGKELVARAIHYNSGRSTHKFVPAAFASLSPSIVETELFGYVSGAFAGARQDKEGLFRAANGGTLFFDEVSAIPIEVQAKVLKAIQNKEITPIGSTAPIGVDVRIIGATSNDLEGLVKENKFRRDLFYRLNVLSLNIPPLRERKEDIPLLVRYFIEKYSNNKEGKVDISEDALSVLLAYSWPGNVRELENIIERAISIGSGDLVKYEELPDKILKSLGRAPSKAPLPEVRSYERILIEKTLDKTNNNILLTAKLLKMGTSTLYRKMKRHSINFKYTKK